MRPMSGFRADEGMMRLAALDRSTYPTRYFKTIRPSTTVLTVPTLTI